MSDCCACGHVREEHARTFLQPCDMAGCDCVAFDAEDDAEDDDDE